MSEFSELVGALHYLVFERLQSKSRFIHCVLGDGQGRVQVPGKANTSYVRPNRSTDIVFEVINMKVSGDDGTPILVGELPEQPGLVQVIGIDIASYPPTSWGEGAAHIGAHARQHEIGPGSNIGSDPLHVYTRALVPLKTMSVGSGSTSVLIGPYDYTYGVQKSWPGLPPLNLSPAIPSTSGTARWVLTYLDPDANTVGIITGTLGVDSEAHYLPRPVLPTGIWIPSAYVRLFGGQSTVREVHIRDARQLLSPGMSTGTSSGGVSSHPLLTNRDAADQHPASSISVDTVPFSGNLGPADDTVQKALETLDALSVSGSGSWKLGSLKVVSKSGAGDYTVIGDALTAAVSGTFILVDVGLWLEGSLVVPVGVWLYGMGQDNTIIQSSDQKTMTVKGGLAHLTSKNLASLAVSYAIYGDEGCTLDDVYGYACGTGTANYGIYLTGDNKRYHLRGAIRAFASTLGSCPFPGE